MLHDDFLVLLFPDIIFLSMCDSLRELFFEWKKQKKNYFCQIRVLHTTQEKMAHFNYNNLLHSLVTSYLESLTKMKSFSKAK